MIKETLDTPSDAMAWAQECDLSPDQTQNLAMWIWSHKPFVGCTKSEHLMQGMLHDADFMVSELV